MEFGLKGFVKMHKAAYRSKLMLLRKTSLTKWMRIMRMDLNPIVIGGSGRSGTTLLLSILSCHPHIFAIDHETRALCPGNVQNPLMNAPFKFERIYNYLAEREIPDHCHRWCEKTPRNVLHFSRILKFYGKRVRIIHIVRDGRDVITSRHPTDPTRFWVSAETWIRDTSAGLQLEDHPQVLTVRYEDLVTKYQPTVRRICEFIDEKFDEAFLHYPEAARVKSNAAWYSDARPIDDTSIGRWKKPQYRIRIFDLLSRPQAVQLLEHFGYLDSDRLVLQRKVG